MNIFNSLGSNYNFDYLKRNIFATTDDESVQKLNKLLEAKYSGKSVPTYKGREALRLALRLFNKKEGYTVGINGFTCFAVYDAIVKEGYKVEFLDIEKDSLNFSFETLEAAFKRNPNLKIIFVQNTLGFPCDMEKISKFCKEKNIILVEDLAHSIRTIYSNGSEAGTVGDFTMLSFSQDKVIDCVSGGALIVRSPKYLKEINAPLRLKKINPSQKLKDKFYPILSVIIRNNYSSGIGKVLHFLLMKIKFLSSPMIYEDMDKIHELPKDYAAEVSSQFQSLEKNLLNRRKIATIYARTLDKNIMFEGIVDSINNSANLRFPIFLDNRKELISFLKNKNIYISDIWYDVPIAPKKYLNKTNYKSGMCPNAEDLASRILNLPTHKNVSENDAEVISQQINLWLKSQ